jgi:WhiB family redox-sensing transcriptional regulator
VTTRGPGALHADELPDLAGAACAGADVRLFYPPTGLTPGPQQIEHVMRETQRIHAAKAYCRRCPIRERCLEHALTAPERHGIWGGLTEHERDLMRKARRKVELRRRGA